MPRPLTDLARRLGRPLGLSRRGAPPRLDDSRDLYRAIDEARAARRIDEAQAYVDAALQRHGDRGPTYERAGFLAFEQGRTDAAVDLFRRGLAVDPDHWPLRFGLFLIADQVRDWAGALEAARPLFGQRDIYGSRAAFLGRLRGVAEALHRAGGADARAEIDALMRAEGDGPEMRAHAIESLNRIGARDAAEAHLRDAPPAVRDHPAVRVAAAEALLGQGRAAAAAEWVEPLLDRGADLRALRTYLSCFEPGEGLAEAAATARVRLGARASEPLVALLLACRSGAYGDAMALLAAHSDPGLRHALFFDLLWLAYAVLGEGRLAEAHGMADLLEETGTSPVHVALLRMNAAFVVQDWAMAAHLLRDVDTRDPTLRLELDLKRFEVACFTGDMDAAGALFARLRDVPDLPAAHHPPLLRYLAEMRRWDDLAALFEARHVRDFRFAQSGGVVFKAYARLGRLPHLRAVIEAVPDWAARPDLRRLRRAALDATATEADAVAAARADPDVAADPVVSARLGLKAAMLSSAARPARGREAIYFCTNATYRRGTAATVASLLQTNLGLLRDMRTVVVTDETDGLSAEVFAALATATGCRIETVEAGGFLDDLERLDPSYGLFTSGTELAASAYFRIFYARRLLEAGEVTRAVYLDSDVLVRGDLSELFAWDLDGAPLAARREAVRPEVRQAAALHGMAPEAYFNSGVLALDLSHPEAGPALDASIHAVLDEGTTLLFHDQCALNIGFKGRVGYLPERFNHFLPPDLADGPVDADAAIVHFLDRPKPWEATYDHRAALDWLRSYETLVPLVGRTLAARLFLEG